MVIKKNAKIVKSSKMIRNVGSRKKPKPTSLTPLLGEFMNALESIAIILSRKHPKLIVMNGANISVGKLDKVPDCDHYFEVNEIAGGMVRTVYRNFKLKCPQVIALHHPARFIGNQPMVNKILVIYTNPLPF